MSHAITADDFEVRLHEASASAVKSKSAVAKDVTIFTMAAGLWDTARKLKAFVELYKQVDFRAISGLSCQHIEKSLTQLISTIEESLALCRSRGLNNRTMTGGAIQSIGLRLDELKDIWVMLSSATDSDLQDAIRAARNEESLDWESVWH